MKKFFTKIFNLIPDEKDKLNYKGWLNSQSLGKRSLAVFGHYVLGYIMFNVLLLLTVFLVVAFTSFFAVISYDPILVLYFFLAILIFAVLVYAIKGK